MKEKNCKNLQLKYRNSFAFVAISIRREQCGCLIMVMAVVLLEICPLNSCYCLACFAYIINNESNYDFTWNRLLICSDLPCYAQAHVYCIK